MARNFGDFLGGIIYRILGVTDIYITMILLYSFSILSTNYTDIIYSCQLNAIENIRNAGLCAKTNPAHKNIGKIAVAGDVTRRLVQPWNHENRRDPAKLRQTMKLRQRLKNS